MPSIKDRFSDSHRFPGEKAETAKRARFAYGWKNYCSSSLKSAVPSLSVRLLTPVENARERMRERFMPAGPKLLRDFLLEQILPLQVTLHRQQPRKLPPSVPPRDPSRIQGLCVAPIRVATMLVLDPA